MCLLIILEVSSRTTEGWAQQVGFPAPPPGKPRGEDQAPQQVLQPPARPLPPRPLLARVGPAEGCFQSLARLLYCLFTFSPLTEYLLKNYSLSSIFFDVLCGPSLTFWCGMLISGFSSLPSFLTQAIKAACFLLCTDFAASHQSWNFILKNLKCPLYSVFYPWLI